MEHILFLTGRLAQRSLERVLAAIDPVPFTWEVRELGLQVAALMTADMIRRRVTSGASGPLAPFPGTDAPRRVDRIIVPGRCRGDVDALTRHYGIPVERGPEEVKDLPLFFNRAAKPIDLDEYDIAIFAEIVDAPRSASTRSLRAPGSSAPTAPTSSTWAACPTRPSVTWPRAFRR